MMSSLEHSLRGTAKETRLVECFNLETAVEREKAVQEIYVHREFLKLVVTLWVIRDFKSFLGLFLGLMGVRRKITVPSQRP
jgi:hypothetical protein